MSYVGTYTGRVRERLNAWKQERATNQYKLAYLADRAIALLQEELRALGEPEDHA